MDGQTSEDEYDSDHKSEDNKKIIGFHDDNKEELESQLVNQVLCESAERLPFKEGEPWQGEQEDSIPSTGRKNPPLKKFKIKNEGLNEMTSTKFVNNDKDASIFDSINGNDLKNEVAKNIKSSMKFDSVDIFITGPFCNEKNGKSIWSVVYGDYGSAWMLKSQFIKGYVRTLLTKVKKTNIDLAHSNSYYDINIRKYEFGNESVWRHSLQNKTTKRLSFVYTCNTSNEKKWQTGFN